MIAVLSHVAISLLYVGLLYVFGSGPRHEDQTIKRRTAAVLLVCSIAWLPAYVLKAPHQQQPLLQQFGLSSPRWAAAAGAALAAVAALYTGPLAHAVLSPTARRALLGPWRVASRWAVTRQLLVAPLAEEWCFRAAPLPPLAAEGWSRGQLLVLLPAVFGAAHLHGALEARKRGAAWGQALGQALFQAVYTSLFGAYATWLLLVTGSLAAPVAAHVACNALGVPDFGAMAADNRWPLLRVLLWAGIAGFVGSFSLMPRLFP